MLQLLDQKVGVIGLGYVGLPLALEFAKCRDVIGYDVNKQRVENLRLGIDSNGDCDAAEFNDNNIQFTNILYDIKACSVDIVTVPTPIDGDNHPDLTLLKTASKQIAPFLEPGNVVIYESTVYPGTTEEVCIPLLEKSANLELNKDFFVGYSPERINPGDKQRKLPDIIKITSGSNSIASDFVFELYSQIITAGVHKAESIKTAEAAKVIENTQRDINIAVMNEFAIIFDRLGIDTLDVLRAAGTKWNFQNFRPGLVGGHCISIDPYYLAYKSQEAGYQPDLILTARAINEAMPRFIAEKLISHLMLKKINPVTARVLILGITFKENCPDMRNSKVISILEKLGSLGVSIDVFDPVADTVVAEKEYDIDLVSEPCLGEYDACIVAVPHTVVKDMGVDKIRSFLKKNSVMFDLKGIFPPQCSDFRL